MESIQSSSVNLPLDVIMEILSWLPVIFLLRFRSVSKIWKNLIDQPHFISSHQSKMKSKLLVTYYDHTKNSSNCLLYPDETLSDNYQEFDIDRYSIYGPCNGVFAVRHNERIALWNPAIKQFRVLRRDNRPQLSPNPYNNPENLRRTGFEFDPTTNDYKVILYREFGDQTPIYQLLVYSLNTNSWRELDPEKLTSFRFNYTLDYEPLPLNGFLYWKGLENGNESQACCRSWLLPFDLSGEQFQEQISVPNPSPGTGLQLLDVCGGCIAVVDCKFTEDSLQLARIWVMVEKGYWVPKFEIGPLEGIMRPFGMWKNDNVLFETNANELVVCNSLGQIWNIIPPFGSDLQCLKTLVYSESLVSVKGDDHGNESDEEDDGVADFLLLPALSLNG